MNQIIYMSIVVTMCLFLFWYYRSGWTDHHRCLNKANLLPKKRNSIFLWKNGKKGNSLPWIKIPNCSNIYNFLILGSIEWIEFLWYVFRTWSRPWRGRCLDQWKVWSLAWWRAQPSMTPQRSEDPSRYSREALSRAESEGHFCHLLVNH